MPFLARSHCAQALGKTEAELRAEKVPESLVAHKVFTGNRPSSSLLVGRLDAYTTGQLLALFEHRCARAQMQLSLGISGQSQQS